MLEGLCRAISVPTATDNAGAQRLPRMPVAAATPRIERMSGLPPSERLAKLRAVEAWLDWQLRDTRRRIEQVAEQVRAVDGYVTEQERHAGKAVGVTIHAADCAKIGQAVTTLHANDAQRALLRDPSFNHPCEHCRPDKALGITKE